jgi:hypothetical protein
MTAEELESLLKHAKEHGEAVLHEPPDGFELVKWAKEEDDERWNDQSN